MLKFAFNLWVFLAIVSISGALYQPVWASGQILWHSYDDGKSLAQAQKKKIFISFYADWCTFCRTMEQKTFKQTDVIDYLNTNFINIKVNVEREKSVAAQYGINPLPDSWFLSAAGAVIGNRPGYLSPQELMPMLHFIHSESYLKMSFREFRESL